MGTISELWAKQTMTPTLIKTNLPPTCYILKIAEMYSLWEFLHGVKVSSSGYSTNIRKLVDMKDHKLIGIKSHDYHVMITHILPIAIRGLMEPGVRKTSEFNHTGACHQTAEGDHWYTM